MRFSPAVGGEIRKDRPAVVVSLPTIGRLPLRIVVPVTEWRPSFEEIPWLVPLPAELGNGLTKDSTADCFQVKSASLDRFIEKIGRVSAERMEEIAAGIALCVGHFG